MTKYVQFIWWWSFAMWRVEFRRIDETRYGSWAFIYSWRLNIGPLEIRKLAPPRNWWGAA